MVETASEYNYVSHPRGRIKFRRVIAFNGSLPNDMDHSYLVSGFRLNPFWSDEVIEIDNLIITGHYSGFLYIPHRYLRIRSGTRVVSLLRYIGRREIPVGITYPWNPYESVGGLLASGFPLFQDVEPYIHMVKPGEEKLIQYSYGSLGTTVDGVISDIHIDGFNGHRVEQRYLIFSHVSSDEVVALTKILSREGINYTLLKDERGYIILLQPLKRELRIVINLLTRVVDSSRLVRERLGEMDLANLPIIPKDYLHNSPIYLGIAKSLPTDKEALKEVIYLDTKYMLMLTNAEGGFSRVIKHVEKKV